MFVDRCVYYQGQHVFAGRHCPHEQPEDETGPVIDAGWTVQSGNS